MLPELAHIAGLLHMETLPLGRFGLQLWLPLGLVLATTVKTENFQDRPFACNLRTLLLTVGMLVWPIVSLSGISTFLYFNF